MSVRMRGFVATLVCCLALAACGSGGTSLEDAAPLPADSVPLPRPPPKLAAASAPPEMKSWRHVPEPVSAGQFDQDKAKCTKLAHSSPGAGSPELKFYLVFNNCMQSQGYEASSRL
jgi:hypothetical protein